MPAENKYEKQNQNKIQRNPRRAHYDHQTVYDVVDAAWLGQLGFLDEVTKQVTVIPMLHAREKDELIFHGAKSSRLMKYLGSGQTVCIAFTLVDGLVLAKSLYHHSLNYRSAVIFGSGQIVNDPDTVIDALRILSEKVMPGRWEDARQPNERELSATSVVKVKIELASAKVRTGPPSDDTEDHGLPVWSGVLPMVKSIGAPIADSHSTTLPLPSYFSDFLEGSGNDT